MQYTQTPVCLRLCGVGSTLDYPAKLETLISKLQLEDRIILDNRWISEEEKAEILSVCLATAYLPVDEDSYGYPSLESSLSSKPILTTTDSGGVLELVEDDINGYITEPLPENLAEAMDKLYLNRKKTKALGENAYSRLKEYNISWPYVLERLLA